MFKSKSPTFKIYTCALLLLAAITFWNFQTWTKGKAIVIEFEPKPTRNIASIGDTQSVIKKKQVETIIIDWTKDQDVSTKYRYVRLALENCDTNVRIKNLSNHFEASMWQEDDIWLSDYIPLQNEQNAIEIFTDGEDPTKTIMIQTRLESHDAI